MNGEAPTNGAKRTLASDSNPYHPYSTTRTPRAALALPKDSIERTTLLSTESGNALLRSTLDLSPSTRRPPHSQNPSTSTSPSAPTSASSTLPPSYTSSSHQSQSQPTQQTLPPNPPISSSAFTNDSKFHLLLCASGSVATIKLPQILLSLSIHPALSIRLILTSSALKFLSGVTPEQPPASSLLDIPNVDAIYTDPDEWTPSWTRNAPILHIELRKWADLMVIAPLSANMMAKMTSGIADDLLSSVLRAWDTTGLVDAPPEGTAGKRVIKRVVVAPAMNTAMWMHPVTGEQIEKLEGKWGVEKGGWVEVLRPQEKRLACGDVGAGGMREWGEIVRLIEERIRMRMKGGETGVAR